MGGGSYPTDVGAHLWGFLFGLAHATLAARLALQSSPILSKSLLPLAFALPTLAWLLALR